MRLSASAASLHQSAAGPVIVKTSQRNLGDTGPPLSTGRSTSRGQRYLNRRLSNKMSLDRSKSNVGLLGNTTGTFGTLIRGGNIRGHGYDTESRDNDTESETASLFRGHTPMQENKSKHGGEGTEKVDPGVLRALCARLKPKIKDSWKTIRQDMKSADLHRSGSVPSRTFRSVMARHEVTLSEDDFYMVMQRFSRSVAGNKNVHYDSFLRMVLR